MRYTRQTILGAAVTMANIGGFAGSGARAVTPGRRSSARAPARTTIFSAARRL